MIFKKHCQNCASSEQAGTTSKTLTEYTEYTIASNKCDFKTCNLGPGEIQEFGSKGMKNTNYSLVLSLLAENSIL